MKQSQQNYFWVFPTTNWAMLSFQVKLLFQDFMLIDFICPYTARRTLTGPKSFVISDLSV